MYKHRVQIGKSFTDVAKGEDVVYKNAIGNIAMGTRLDNFADKYNLEAGIGWSISIITNNK